MKKTYIIPTCVIYKATAAPLCASVVIKDVDTSGGDGGWSKGWSGGGFDENESSAEKSSDLFD